MEYTVLDSRHPDPIGRASIQPSDGSGQPIRASLLERANLVRSAGPWLVVDSSTVVFDAIDAGRGLGYNAGPLFGMAQHPSTWTHDGRDPELQGVRHAIECFLARKPNVLFNSNDVATPRDLVGFYIATNVLDQFDESVAKLEITIRDTFQEMAPRILGQRVIEFLGVFRVHGRTLQLDFPAQGREAMRRLLEQGVLASTVSKHTIEFQVPLSTPQAELNILAERVLSAWLGCEAPPVKVSLRDSTRYYDFHKRLLKEKLLVVRGGTTNRRDWKEHLEIFLPTHLRDSATLHIVTGENWHRFRELVERLQKAVYEPVRQTSLKTFDALFSDPFGFGLIVEIDRDIAGLAAAGPLGIFPNERGTLEDPQCADRHTLYPVDVTVAPDFRGSLGSYLKSAMVLLGTATGHSAFHGRNRDRMAAAMWAINLSLGSYQIRHLKDDYPDTLPFRDCIYYRCPLKWLHGSDAIDWNENEFDTQIAWLIHGV